jgi:hypothetical protein
MGCGNSTVKDKEPVLETVAVVDSSKVDKLKFRQPTVVDLLGEERAELDAKLLRWGSQVFDALDVGQKGFATGAGLASELKKLPPTKSPKLALVSCSCHPTRCLSRV